MNILHDEKTIQFLKNRSRARHSSNFGLECSSCVILENEIIMHPFLCEAPLVLEHLFTVLSIENFTKLVRVGGYQEDFERDPLVYSLPGS